MSTAIKNLKEAINEAEEAKKSNDQNAIYTALGNAEKCLESFSSYNHETLSSLVNYAHIVSSDEYIQLTEQLSKLSAEDTVQREKIDELLTCLEQQSYIPEEQINEWQEKLKALYNQNRIEITPEYQELLRRQEILNKNHEGLHKDIENLLKLFSQGDHENMEFWTEEFQVLTDDIKENIRTFSPGLFAVVQPSNKFGFRGLLGEIKDIAVKIKGRASLSARRGVVIEYINTLYNLQHGPKKDSNETVKQMWSKVHDILLGKKDRLIEDLYSAILTSENHMLATDALSAILNKITLVSPIERKLNMQASLIIKDAEQELNGTTTEIIELMKNSETDPEITYYEYIDNLYRHAELYNSLSFKPEEKKHAVKGDKTKQQLLINLKNKLGKKRTHKKLIHKLLLTRNMNRDSMSSEEFESRYNKLSRTLERINSRTAAPAASAGPCRTLERINSRTAAPAASAGPCRTLERINSRAAAPAASAGPCRL